MKNTTERKLVEMMGRIFRSPPSPEGMGDDCSVVKIGGETLLFTTDMLTESSHFRHCINFEQRGKMAMAVNLSDIAAMGGHPDFALVAIGIPPSMAQKDLLGFIRGIHSAADSNGVRILGGDTKRANELTVSITLCGRSTGKPLLRSGARAGDYLAVTGRLGDASWSYYALSKGLPDRSGKLCRPIPRIGEGMCLAGSGLATSAIDITDGLAISAWYVSRASGVRLEIDYNSIPVSARLRKLDVDDATRNDMLLNWGGDYELLFTLRGERGLAKLRKEKALNFTVIGRVTKGKGVYISVNGMRRRLDERGYDSFAQGPA